MVGKGDANREYRIHGDGVATLRAGFDEVAMPPFRRAEAMRIVTEVLDANAAVDFRWYKPEGTLEIASYWDHHDRNVMWVTPAEVHILADETRVKRPSRSLTWWKGGGDYVGWLLPGAEKGLGGGRREPAIATVLCPLSYLRIPVGSVCPACDIVHS